MTPLVARSLRWLWRIPAEIVGTPLLLRYTWLRRQIDLGAASLFSLRAPRIVGWTLGAARVMVVLFATHRYAGPEWAAYRAAQALQSNDITTFERVVDADSLASGFFSDWMKAEAARPDPAFPPALASAVQPELVRRFQGAIRKRVMVGDTPHMGVTAALPHTDSDGLARLAVQIQYGRKRLQTHVRIRRDGILNWRIVGVDDSARLMAALAL